MNREKYYKLIKKFIDSIEMEAIDPVEISTELNMNPAELIKALFNIIVILFDDCARLRKENATLRERVQATEKSLQDAYENPQKRQNALVKNGLKVRKPKLDVTELMLLQKLNYTDEDIMKYADISRATLWRKKKELEKYLAEQEAKKQGRR